MFYLYGGSIAEIATPREPAMALLYRGHAFPLGLQARCLFRMSGTSAIPLGAPGSSPAPEATLERGAPRENPRTGHEFMKQTLSGREQGHQYIHRRGHGCGVVDTAAASL